MPEVLMEDVGCVACVCVCVRVLPVVQLLLMSTLHAVQLGVHWPEDASQLQIEHG